MRKDYFLYSHFVNISLKSKIVDTALHLCDMLLDILVLYLFCQMGIKYKFMYIIELCNHVNIV